MPKITLQRILSNFVQNYPEPGNPPQITLTVGTHDRERDNSKFRLSDAGRCRLMRYYKRKGTFDIPAPSADLLQLMQAGHLIHAWVQYAVEYQHGLVSAEVPLEDTHRIGHYDLLIEHPKTTHRILYEVKTISAKKDFYRVKQFPQADKHHIYQLVSYALMLPEPVDNLRIAYIVRDTMNMSEIPINQKEYEDEVLKDWAHLIAAWKSQTPPEPTTDAWECRYCPYTANCKGILL